MGDDEKLIGDIAEAAENLKPKFIAIAGTPIPAMTGFDFTAVAELIEDRTGIPTFGFPTTGMNTYVVGADMAWEGIARRFVDRSAEKTAHLSANILGLTPLDFSINGSDTEIVKFVEDAGFEVISTWAMKNTLEELSQAGKAHVNLVVSSTGLGVAKVLNELFGTPYVIGTPIGTAYQEQLKQTLLAAVSGCETNTAFSKLPDPKIAVIGEAVTSLSLAQAIELTYQKGVKVLCTTECPDGLLREHDILTSDEDEIIAALENITTVIADPLYRPICPEHATFIPLPAESFSGRLYRNEIPNLISGFQEFVL